MCRRYLWITDIEAQGCSAVGMHFFFAPSLSLSGSMVFVLVPVVWNCTARWCRWLKFVDMKWLVFGRKTKLEWRDSCPEMEDLLQSYLCHAWGPKLWIGISFANKRMKWTIIPQRSMSRSLSTYHFSIHFPILSKNYVPQPLLLKNPRKLSLRLWCFPPSLPGAAGAKFEPVARSTYMATRVEALKSSNIRLILEETEELIPEMLRVYGMHCMMNGQKSSEQFIYGRNMKTKTNTQG